ncbi:MAG: lipid-binding SYLF domain-containing protein [Blastochloris sp.]|nr:lipid-binding SYLF domain-containing protein [Blastochloris sp.]
MKNNLLNPGIAAFLGLVLLGGISHAGVVEDDVKNAISILSRKQGSAYPIPTQELKEAKGVAVVDISKGGFVIGGTGGSGVVLLKVKKGLKGWVGITSWSAPIPVTFSGASFGAQIGGSNTKAIILLNSDAAVSKFTSPGKLGWMAEATGTAGADTERERAGGLLSDVDTKIYKQEEGLYGGAVFGGAALAINEKAIKQAYGPGIFLRDILEGKVKLPEYAVKLAELLDGKR